MPKKSSTTGGRSSRAPASSTGGVHPRPRGGTGGQQQSRGGGEERASSIGRVPSRTPLRGLASARMQQASPLQGPTPLSARQNSPPPLSARQNSPPLRGLSAMQQAANEALFSPLKERDLEEEEEDFGRFGAGRTPPGRRSEHGVRSRSPDGLGSPGARSRSRSSLEGRKALSGAGDGTRRRGRKALSGEVRRDEEEEDHSQVGGGLCVVTANFVVEARTTPA